MRNHPVNTDDTNVTRKLSNAVRSGSGATNAMLVVAYAYLIHEVGAVAQIVLRAFGHG